MSATAKALIAEYASAPTPPSPPPSPLSPLSSPLPQIPSPSLPLPSSPTTSPTYVEAPLGYRAAGIRLRVASLSTHHPLKIELPPLLLPSTSHIDDTPEADMLLRKRARFTTLTSGFKVGESSAAAGARQPVLDVATVDATPGCIVSGEVGYRIEDVWDDMVGDMEERAPTTIEGLSQRVTDLSTTLAWDTHEIHVLIESKARCTMQAWRQAIDCNRAIHVELQAYRAQLTIALARIQTLEGREPARIDDTENAGSSSIMYGMLSIMGVADALAEIEANRTSRNGDDNHDSGTGSRRIEQFAREMELVFHISNCAVGNQIKFVTCTLLGSAITGEIKKLEIEIWKLKVKGTDIASYMQCFQELALMCGPGEKKQYGVSKPLCPKCNYHHDGQCAPKCTNCKRTGHLTQDYRIQPATANNQRAQG
ncbi:hypothetical protein Tco_0359163 [Tanacetum coccineum]